MISSVITDVKSFNSDIYIIGFTVTDVNVMKPEISNYRVSQ